MECVKTCPEGNISLGFQAPGHDLLRAGGRLDEAYRAFISVAAVIVYLVVMLGPWGNLKMWAARPLEPTFLLFLGRLAGLSLVMLPGLFLGASYVSTWLVRAKGATARQRWTGSAYALVPLAMTAWMALALGFLSSGGAYVASAVSDPLGRGWDLFGTANIEWRPLFPTVLPYLQAGAILAGLAWSLAVLGRRPEWALASKGRQWLGLAPMSATFFGVTAAFLWLFLG
jgi:hypothetical protein